MSDIWNLLDQASSALNIAYEDHFIYKNPSDIELSKEEREELLDVLGVISEQVYLLKRCVEGEESCFEYQ